MQGPFVSRGLLRYQVVLERVGPQSHARNQNCNVCQVGAPIDVETTHFVDPCKVVVKLVASQGSEEGDQS